ncbi:MAG: hypothetical protein EXR72_02365 [Myxococcales bacterium]|nr:hypothetical protein [Myxococcales bacterium]
MKRLVLVLMAVCGTAEAGNTPTLVSTDFRPNRDFPRQPEPSHAAEGAAAVEQIGEVVIMEGDADLVTDDGHGRYGIVADNFGSQQSEITARFYTKYADQFDEVVIFTTFDDQGAQGALAYEISTQQDVTGIGQKRFDQSGKGGWGAPDHKLFAFVNMMRWDQFSDFDGLSVTDPNSELYPTLAQEFAHRWLSFLRYRDKAGKFSSAMLGRDKAHWVATMQTDASVMDGNRLVDHYDGTFVNVETNARYSELDLYAMGLIAPAEMKPWFLVTSPLDRNGNKINPANTIRVGARISGTRENITIAQVEAAEGVRVPSSALSPHAFRVAFLLVTRPGERAGEVIEIARQIDVVRKVWEAKFREYTAGRGTMCTQVSAPCGAATAKVVSGRFVEAGGNGNGVVEPGEPVEVIFALKNDGPRAAMPVSVTATSDGITVSEGATMVSAIAPGQTVEVAIGGMLPLDAACGKAITVRVETVAGGHTFRGFAEVTPGLAAAYSAPFAQGAGYFGVNLDGKDSTTTNGWEYGTPREYRGRFGWIFQPGGCHDSASTRCYFTGLSPGHRPNTDSSLGVGRSTLWSPAIDLAKTYRPTLRYFAWFQAIDYSSAQAGGEVIEGAEMVLEGSADGGRSWKRLDTVDGAEPAWRLREVPLDGKLPLGGPVRLRFTASNAAAGELIEAGIDDLEIVTLTAGCDPRAVEVPMEMEVPIEDGGGCAVGGGRSPATVLALILLLLAAGSVSRRRMRGDRGV